MWTIIASWFWTLQPFIISSVNLVTVVAMWWIGRKDTRRGFQYMKDIDRRHDEAMEKLQSDHNKQIQAILERNLRDDN